MPASAASAVAHELRRRPELLGVEDRADALRPQAVGGARPAEPAVEAQVGERDGVAVDAGEADAALAAVGEGARRVVAGGARALAVARTRRVSKNSCRPSAMAAALPETRLLGSRVERRRPRPVRQDRRALGVAEGGRRLVSRHQAPTSAPPLAIASAARPAMAVGGFHGFRVMSCVRRVRLSPWNEVERQPPGAGHVQHQTCEAEAARACLGTAGR